MTKPLSGKAALVTGGAKRIGRAISLALARAGADVVITYRRSAFEAEVTLSEIRSTGRNAFAVQSELSEESSVAQAVAQAQCHLGKIDLLVNNAGTFASVPLAEISVEQWDEMYAANVRGPFLMARQAYPLLKQVQGKIINIGSLGGMVPWPTHAHYCTSKAALHMLSKTMAKAWAPEVSVNCVAPGMIVQDEVGNAYRAFADRTPMKRNGTAQDVAEAVLYFASAPHFITGQVLAVDGGLGL